MDPSIVTMRLLFLHRHHFHTLHGTRYSVFDQLILNPLFSIMALHLSSSSSTSSAVSLTSTKSSATGIGLGGLVLASSANTSMMLMKRSGLSEDPWCNPTLTSKYSVLPHIVLTLVFVPLYACHMSPSLHLLFFKIVAVFVVPPDDSMLICIKP